jgi:hypothetical protein
MYEFEDSMTEHDKAFFGYNDGTPWLNPNSSGMLDAKHNVLNYPCNENNRTNPYFEPYSSLKYQKSKSQDEYLFNTIKNFSSISISLNDRNVFFPQIDALPDGAYKIKESNNKTLSYNVQINDLRYWQYHRNNGITKIGIIKPEDN